MKHSGTLIALLLLAVVAVAAANFSWPEDMRDQPSIKPQEALVTMPRDSVPIGGTELFAAPADSSELVRARLIAGAVPNPQPADEASLQRGAFLYETHCLVCHGASGRGDGPVGMKFTPQPIDLTIAYVRRQPDGQLYYTISHGGVVMPAYRDAIRPDDRWHLVNYIQQAFGKQTSGGE